MGNARGGASRFTAADVAYAQLLTRAAAPRRRDVPALPLVRGR